MMEAMQDTEQPAGNAAQKLKIYCETSFWSYLVGGPTSDEKVARWQALSRKWWEEIAPLCEIFISQYVVDESEKGYSQMAARRKEACASALRLDGKLPEVYELAEELRHRHAIPKNEVTDSLHIATASVYAMDVLLTWNCRHMANIVTLPKTVSIVARAGYECPAIITPEDFFNRREEFEL
jgi:predicted nucleic acid-binding protein